MSHKEEFLRNFQRKRAVGLVDTKFLVADDVSEDDIFRAANAIDDSVASGKFEKHGAWPMVEQTDITELLAK